MHDHSTAPPAHLWRRPTHRAHQVPFECWCSANRAAIRRTPICRRSCCPAVATPLRETRPATSSAWSLKQACFHLIEEGLLELIVSRATFWSRRSGPLFLGHICSPQSFIGAKGISERQAGSPFIAQECHDMDEVRALRGVSPSTEYTMPRNTSVRSVVVSEALQGSSACSQSSNGATPSRMSMIGFARIPMTAVEP